MKLPRGQSGLERCFECIPARSVTHDEHCVPSALVSPRAVRARIYLAACKTLGISSKAKLAQPSRIARIDRVYSRAAVKRRRDRITRRPCRLLFTPATGGTFCPWLQHW